MLPETCNKKTLWEAPPAHPPPLWKLTILQLFPIDVIPQRVVQPPGGVRSTQRQRLPQEDRPRSGTREKEACPKFVVVKKLISVL